MATPASWSSSAVSGKAIMAAKAAAAEKTTSY
jgi:hypothetical protein